MAEHLCSGPINQKQATLMWRRKITCNCRPLPLIVLIKRKLCLRNMILWLFCSWATPLFDSAKHGHLDICHLLLQCNADVNAKNYR